MLFFMAIAFTLPQDIIPPLSAHEVKIYATKSIFQASKLLRMGYQ